MNRRNFLKFLGQATAASGIALVAGLPNVPIDSENGLDKVIDEGGKPAIAEWDDIGFNNGPADHLYFGTNGVLYAGGTFTTVG